MKLQIATKTFEKILKPVVKASSSNKTLQILTHIYLKAKDDKIEIVGANPEYAVRVNEWADVDKSGEFLVLGEKLLQIIKSLPDDFVNIESISSDSIMVLSGNSKFLIQTIPIEEYPKQILELTQTSYNFDVSQGEMRKIIKKLRKFCAKDDTIQAVFTGFLFDLKETGDLTIVTTDTKRMGIYYSSYKAEESTKNIKFVVPAGTLEILEDTLADEGPLKVGLNFDEDNSVKNVVFSTPSITMSSSVISGTFPNYEPIIPTYIPNYLVIDKDAIEGAIKRVSIMSDKETNKMKFEFRDTGIVVSAENSILGTAEEFVPCKTIQGKDYILFNYEFILDYLSVADGTEIYWGFDTPMSPNKFWSEDEKEFIYIAMPLRRD